MREDRRGYVPSRINGRRDGPRAFSPACVFGITSRAGQREALAVQDRKNTNPSARRPSRTKVMIVCIGNACRSPMAEAIARYDAADVIDASSAGVSPIGFIPDLTKRTLTMNGYSADGLTSAKTTQDACDSADIIINMTGRRWGEI